MIALIVLLGGIGLVVAGAIPGGKAIGDERERLGGRKLTDVEVDRVMRRTVTVEQRNMIFVGIVLIVGSLLWLSLTGMARVLP